MNAPLSARSPRERVSMRDEPPQAASLEENIAAYEARRQEMERDHKGKYAVFYNREKIGCFDTFDAAAREAVRKFGRGPYLIRKVGRKNIRLPASAMFACSP